MPGTRRVARLALRRPCALGPWRRDDVLDVRAELTATVWKVVAEVGATVAAGDELLILESMKMEIPVTAPEAGTLAEMRVGEGDSVAEGDVLAVVATS